MEQLPTDRHATDETLTYGVFDGGNGIAIARCH
jgi:hypothetical protein